LAQTVQRRILGNEALHGLALPEIDGRIDLRNLPFPAHIRQFSDVQLRGVDLSGAMLANIRITDSTFENCTFDGANCQFWHLRGSLVVGCSFVKADLRNSTLGEWFDGRGNTYRRVNFGSARLFGSTTSAAVYEDCDFSHADLKRINFWQSSLIRCKFAGPVREVVFDGRMLGEGKPTSNPMEQVDLSDATLDGCDFRGVTFDSVVLPADPALIRIRDVKTIDLAVAALAGGRGDLRSRLAEVVLDNARQLLETGGDVLLNLRDVGPAAELLSGLLHEKPAREGRP
jgi:uncharacterized protein YjbI with pentapeptide repeats